MFDWMLQLTPVNTTQRKDKKKKTEERRGGKWTEVVTNLRWTSRSVVHGGRASFLLHKDSFPLLPAARWLGQLSLRCLLSSHWLGQLPLLPIVIGCKCTADVENNAPRTKLKLLIRGNYTLCSAFFIAVAKEVTRIITETHCIWFLSEQSSFLGTCRWRGRGWRGSGSIAASHTPSGRSLGSGLPDGRSGWWSDRFSLYIWKKKERGSREDMLWHCQPVITFWSTWQWMMIACAVMTWKGAILGEPAWIQIVSLMRLIQESWVWYRLKFAVCDG